MKIKVLSAMVKVLDVLADHVLPGLMAGTGIGILLFPPPGSPDWTSYAAITAMCGVAIFMVGSYRRRAERAEAQLQTATLDRLKDIEAWQRIMSEGGNAEITRRTVHLDDHTEEHVTIKAKIGAGANADAPAGPKNSFGS